MSSIILPRQNFCQGKTGHSEKPDSSEPSYRFSFVAFYLVPGFKIEQNKCAPSSENNIRVPPHYSLCTERRLLLTVLIRSAMPWKEPELEGEGT